AIAEATRHPERVVGMHFFNPAPVLPFVEIVRAPESSDAAVQTAYDWAEHAGKRPVRCNDTPGFIVNRILIPLLNDCVRVLGGAIPHRNLSVAGQPVFPAPPGAVAASARR